jgi:hypothetical protein
MSSFTSTGTLRPTSITNLNTTTNTASGATNIGGIVGGVVGGLLFVIIGSLIVFYTRKSAASLRNDSVVVGAEEQRSGDSTTGGDLSGNLRKHCEDQAGGRLGKTYEDQPGGRLGK